MKISELVEILSAIKEAHGDVEVLADDPSDYGCWPISDVLQPGDKPYTNQGPLTGCLLA